NSCHFSGHTSLPAAAVRCPAAVVLVDSRPARPFAVVPLPLEAGPRHIGVRRAAAEVLPVETSSRHVSVDAPRPPAPAGRGALRLPQRADAGAARLVGIIPAASLRSRGSGKGRGCGEYGNSGFSQHCYLLIFSIAVTPNTLNTCAPELVPFW